MKAPVVLETTGAFFIAAADAHGCINQAWPFRTSIWKLSVFILDCAKLKQPKP